MVDLSTVAVFVSVMCAGCTTSSQWLIYPLRLVLFLLFRVSCFVVCDKPKVDIVCNRFTVANGYISSDIRLEHGKCKPNGLVWGAGVMAFITSGEGNTNIYIICRQAFFDDLVKEGSSSSRSDRSDGSDSSSDSSSSGDSGGDARELTVYDRDGTYDWMYYVPRQIDITFLVPTDAQKAMIDSVVSEFRKRRARTLTVFIHGSPGTGKTSSAMLLADALGATFSKSFNPCEPGDKLTSVVRAVEPTKARPHVQLLDEFDIIVRKVHAGAVVLHKNIPTSVHDKTTLNGFLDDMLWISNTVLVCTSNASKDEIDQLDPCYLRAGRIHMVINL
jgi:hypothetical protein